MKAVNKPVIRGASNDSKIANEKKTSLVTGKVNKVEQRL
jgi:hypothetical protein